MNLSTKLHARKSTKLIALHFSEILRPIPHDFFMITPENSMLFLIYPWKFLLLFLQYYLKFCFLNHPPPPPFFFFWNSPLFQISVLTKLNFLRKYTLSFVKKCTNIQRGNNYKKKILK